MGQEENDPIYTLADGFVERRMEVSLELVLSVRLCLSASRLLILPSRLTPQPMSASKPVLALAANLKAAAAIELAGKWG
jgi:hypothetical protein